MTIKQLVITHKYVTMCQRLLKRVNRNLELSRGFWGLRDPWWGYLITKTEVLWEFSTFNHLFDSGCFFFGNQSENLTLN